LSDYLYLLTVGVEDTVASDHTQRRTTVDRTPLDEESARYRDLYQTTYNTRNRRTSMYPGPFEPAIPAGERPQTYALDRAAKEIGTSVCSVVSHIILSFLGYFHENHSYKMRVIAVVFIVKRTYFKHCNSDGNQAVIPSVVYEIFPLVHHILYYIQPMYQLCPVDYECVLNSSSPSCVLHSSPITHYFLIQSFILYQIELADILYILCYFR
jgi:hypothetical protein